jgi:tetratricopeptide (TPR) repeat protein
MSDTNQNHPSVAPEVTTRTPPPVIPPAGMPRTRRSKVNTHKPAGVLAYVVLILLTIGTYLPMASSDLAWSAYDEVERSPYQSMDSWTEAWSLEMIRNTDPISLSSYYLEQKLPFAPAVSQHAINLLLHILAVILVLKTLDALKLPAAFSTSLIFALHPAVLQTIFWSGYREELLGLILILAALYFGVQNRNGRDFAALMMLSLLAYITHPASLTLPILLSLCIFYQKSRFRLTDYNRVLPLLCLAFFVGVWIRGHHNSEAAATISLNERFAISAQNLFFYLKQSLWPQELTLFHPFSQDQSYSVGAQNSFLPYLLFFPFYVLAAFNLKKSWGRGIILGFSAYLLTLIYGLSQTGFFLDGSLAHEEHLLYVSLPFLLALVICSAAALTRKMGSIGRVIWPIGICLFTALQIFITSNYAHKVSQQAELWHDLTQQWPDTWLPKLALIHTIQESGEASELMNREQMIALLEELLEQQPELLQERQLLARIYRQAGQNSNALRHYKRILRDSTPSNDFLRETEKFYVELGLTWEVQNVRARITD